MKDNAHKAARLVDFDMLYPGRFLKAGLLGNSKRTLTISDIDLNELEGDDGKREKCVVSFADEKMQLVLNKTNGICLREMFGRVPYQWIGKRVCLFAGQHEGDPCIRVWGSPDLAEDMTVTIQLPKRRAFTMTMHAMGQPTTGKRNGNGNMAGKPALTVPLGERCQELLKMMAAAFSAEELTDIEADFATEEFNERESRALSAGLAKRHQQIREAVEQQEAANATIR